MTPIDIVKLCRHYRIPYLDGGGHQHVRNGWVGLACPFCAKKNWTLGYSKTEHYFHCWRCGGLSAWVVLPALLRADKRAIGRVLHEFALQGVYHPANEPIVRQRRVKPPPDLHPLGPQHRRYLKGRGFDPDELAEQWGLQGTGPLAGKWSWRVVYPVYDGAERVVAYQGRSLAKDTGDKYKLTDDEKCLVDPRSILYGVHAVPGDAVIVVEGATGVWRLGPGTVATLGMAWSKSQLNQLRRFKKRFVMLDPGAESRAEKLALELSIFPGTTEVISGLGCQPGELEAGQAKEIAEELLG